MNTYFLRIHSDDTVAVALTDLPGQTLLTVDDVSVQLREPVARGHKFALQDHAIGNPIVKYGQVIGHASQQIVKGQWVHSHNLVTQLAADTLLSWQPASGLLGEATTGEARWLGYERGDRAATRNEIWILPTVGCVARTAQRIAELANAKHAGRLDGIHAFTHPFGCSQLGDDLAGTRTVLARLASHPNAGGVLLVGLGCESNQLDALLDTVPAEARQRIRYLTAQTTRDEVADGVAAVDELVEIAATARRVSMPLSRLSIGLKCGGSDGFSGLTANPLLGRFSDHLAAQGGAVMLTEIPEIFGAETSLLQRAESQAVFDAGLKLINDFKAYFRQHGEPVSENPSPGNIAGGITTLEEKSLGAVQKAGRVPLAAVARYGESGLAHGLTLLEAPGNDAVSSTALAAAGVNLILFTTGRGTPLGFPVPTVKVASNTALAERKPNWIDFDAGPAVQGNLESLDQAFLQCVLAIASGTPTAAERLGQREIAIWKRGVTL